jgi:hypothetical protein
MAFETRVLGGMFVPSREEIYLFICGLFNDAVRLHSVDRVVTGWRTLHILELHNLYFLPNILGRPNQEGCCERSMQLAWDK